jgi:hypothetical protein
METAKQISVFLENKPGRLANVLRALEKQKINVTGMTVMDSHEHSVLRLVTSDEAKTVAVLRDMGANFTNAEVLLVELRNQPGALAHLCEVLAGEHINIDYCYCSAGGRNGRTYGIFKVSSLEKAQRVLAGAGANSTRRRVEKRTLRDRRSYQAPR